LAESSFVKEGMSEANEGVNKAAAGRGMEAWDCVWSASAKNFMTADRAL